MDTQQLVPSVLFPSYKMLRAALNNIDVRRSFLCKVLDGIVGF
jgi:hypothetical protein